MTMQSRIGAAVPYLHLMDRLEFGAHDWPESGSILIKPIWKGVDRPEGGGISLRPTMKADAIRLRDLILRGDAYEGVEVKTDVTGKTYMSVIPRFAVMELAEDLDMLDRIGPRAGKDAPTA